MVKPEDVKDARIAEYLREKELARREDERALKSGEKRPEDLRRENGHFAGLRVRIDFKRAKAQF